MKNIVCYGDSNTWGYIPVTAHRLPFNKRWPGILSIKLGSDYTVFEEGLNGRTTCFDDQIYPFRKGTHFFEEALLTDYPIDLIIIMLGTNDSKIHLGQTSHSISVGMRQLIKTAKNPEYGPNYGEDGKPAKVLVVAPPHINEEIANRTDFFEFDVTSLNKVAGLAPLYKELAEQFDCAFLDASEYTEASTLDCLHITEESHARLAEAMYKKVKELIG